MTYEIYKKKFSFAWKVQQMQKCIYKNWFENYMYNVFAPSNLIDSNHGDYRTL